MKAKLLVPTFKRRFQGIVRGKLQRRFPNCLLAIVTIFAFIALSFIPKAFAYDPNNPSDVYNANRQNQQQQAQIAKSQDDIDEALNQVQTDVTNLEQYDIPAAKMAVEVADNNYNASKAKAENLAKRLQAATEDKERIEQQLDDASNQFDSSKTAIASLAREEMRGSDDAQSLQVIMAASDSMQFVDNMEMQSAAARTQARLLNNAALVKAGAMTKDARIKIVNDLIDKLKIQADEEEKKAEQAKADAEEWKAKVDQLEIDLVAKKKQLQIQQANLEAQKAAAAAEGARIAAEMAEIAKKQQEAAQGGGSFDGTGGYFTMPTDYHKVTAEFGYDPSHPYTANHTGIDFGAPCGAPIYAAASGTVLYADISYSEGGALRVAIDHGVNNGSSWITRYYHLSAFGTSAGAWVERGQVIGYTGTTGWSTGCHLHFEVWKNGVVINPRSVL